MSSAPKPDFTGTWRWNRDLSALEIAAPDASVFRVEHRDPLLKISRTHTFRGAEDTFSLDLRTDGSEIAVERGEARLHCRAYWEQEVLVFDTRITYRGADAHNLVRYQLSPDHNRLTAAERFRSEALSYDNRWVLDRA